MSSILNDKDVNAGQTMQAFDAKAATGGGDIKSMEYHRQVLQSKLEQNQNQQYVSPSDNIMSPCTAKLSAYRNKQVGLKSKPKSLFAKTSAKNLSASGAAEPMFADKPSEA